MGTVIHTRAVVGPDGTIEIRAPELTPGQQVEVTLEVQLVPEAGRHVSEIIKELPGHLHFETTADVDAYLREVRDSWDR